LNLPALRRACRSLKRHALSRACTFFLRQINEQGVDGRDKPGHESTAYAQRSRTMLWARDRPYAMAMSGHNDHAASRERAFFGRRKGHRLRSRQAELIATLLPPLAIALEEPSSPGRLAEMFSRPLEAVRLEIGFGGGENLIAAATEHPATGFIGCEPFVNGMAKILASIDAGAIDNVRLYAGDAIELLAWLPDASIAVV